jgi:hypothetical protein
MIDASFFVLIRVSSWIAFKKKAVESGIHGVTKNKKPWVPQCAYPWFQSVSGPVRLLRPTGRLAEKKASPKIKTARAKEPVDHLIL